MQTTRSRRPPAPSDVLCPFRLSACSPRSIAAPRPHGPLESGSTNSTRRTVSNGPPAASWRRPSFRWFQLRNRSRCFPSSQFRRINPARGRVFVCRGGGPAAPGVDPKAPRVPRAKRAALRADMGQFLGVLSGKGGKTASPETGSRTPPQHTRNAAPTTEQTRRAANLATALNAHATNGEGISPPSLGLVASAVPLQLYLLGGPSRMQYSDWHAVRNRHLCPLTSAGAFSFKSQ